VKSKRQIRIRQFPVCAKFRIPSVIIVVETAGACQQWQGVDQVLAIGTCRQTATAREQVGDNPEGHLQLGIQNQRQDRQRFRDHHGSPARGGWPVLPKARFVPKSDSQIDWFRHDDRDGLPDGSFQEIITVCPDTR